MIAGSTSGTVQRMLRRILGTAVGVPLGLACLPIAAQWPLLVWIAAFALIVTMAAGGDTSVGLLVSRAWETLIGGALGLATALLLLPIRERRPL